MNLPRGMPNTATAPGTGICHCPVSLSNFHRLSEKTTLNFCTLAILTPIRTAREDIKHTQLTECLEGILALHHLGRQAPQRLKLWSFQKR